MTRVDPQIVALWLRPPDDLVELSKIIEYSSHLMVEHEDDLIARDHLVKWAACRYAEHFLAGENGIPFPVRVLIDFELHTNDSVVPKEWRPELIHFAMRFPTPSFCRKNCKVCKSLHKK